MKYIFILIGVIVITSYLTSKSLQDDGEFNINQKIDTIICRTVESYGEDPEVGDKFLFVSTECDTIYEK